MKFEHNLVGETLVFSVQNVLLDANGADKFKREMLLVLNQDDFTNIVIDLDSVKMVDSSGLGALLFARRQVVQKGGECYLVNPAPKVTNLLKISKLTDAFQFADSIEEALEAADESPEELYNDEEESEEGSKKD